MEPGPLIASGRDGSIYEFGPGLVLRKTNDGRSLAGEARTMEYVAQQGFPVPAIHELRSGGSEMVMERIEGPLMLGDGISGAMRLPRMLGILADLHDQLHRIVAPDWLPSFGEGDRLLHLDLHPLNVIMSPTRGPVVIDWPNATRGDPMADVALTYVLLTCPRIPVPPPLEIGLNAVRTPLVKRAFARRYRGRAFDEYVALMADLKCLDVHMAPDEIERMQALANRMRRTPRAPG
jgi:aminoglycoside phosphotransferase (APT) family kinase protein